MKRRHRLLPALLGCSPGLIVSVSAFLATPSSSPLRFLERTPDVHVSLLMNSIGAEPTGDALTLDLPEQSPKGVYRIQTEEQYNNLFEANPDKLIVVKFFAGYCQACRIMEPKFIAVKNDKQLEGLPVIWAEFMAQRHNKDLFQRLRVLTLPTIHFYDGSRGIVENFACGPAKIPVLKKKLAKFLNNRVDPDTLQLKPAAEVDSAELEPIEPRVTRQLSIDNEFITSEHIDYLRNLPFFITLTDQEFNEMISKAKLLTFNPGDMIIRQGMPGNTFYIIKTGVAEMGVRSKFDDPISTPPDYLGAVMGTLEKFDYFGERACTTGEPLAASVRVLEKVRCFAFNAEDIPSSSILSKKRRATREVVEQLNQRYELPEDYMPEYLATPRDECILELLVRFKQIRQAAKCFEYVMQSKPLWGDQGEIARRTVLVRKLSKSQREEFQEVFNMVDVNKRGSISLLEMRKFMESARAKKSDEELMEMLARANSRQDVAPDARTNPTTAYLSTLHNNMTFTISRDEFMGVMAESEFFNLFTETFQELDKDGMGYVRAGDLDEILGCVRGLISDEKAATIINAEDKAMLVDYEQFSRMLIGAAI